MTETADLPPIVLGPEPDLDALRRIQEPFPAEQIGKLPRVTCPDCSKKRCQQHVKKKCPICNAYVSERHIHIDFVGHADLTFKLLELDPLWTWEPMAFDADGLPAVRERNGMLNMWIQLTFGGVTRPGVGTVQSGKPDAEKELIGNALRNAAMRFGAALDLWSKSERESGTSIDAPDTIEDHAPGPSAGPGEPPANPDDIGDLLGRIRALDDDIKAALREESNKRYREGVYSWSFQRPADQWTQTEYQDCKTWVDGQLGIAQEGEES